MMVCSVWHCCHKYAVEAGSPLFRLLVFKLSSQYQNFHISKFLQQDCFNPLMHGGNKNFTKLKVCLSMCDLSVTTRH